MFVDLASVQDPALVLPAIAAALGVRESGGRPLAETLAAAAHDRRLLLVFDNLEHLLPALPAIVSLLRAAPRARVLATSRASLRVPGEQTLPVNPLDVPSQAGSSPPVLFADLAGSAAVRLFAERAAAVEPGFSLTERNVEAVAAICRRLDGLPLAIELAAARANLLEPTQLLARLDPRLTLLRGGAATPSGRPRAMRDAIRWSLDLLSLEERRLFANASVFRGGFSLAAAEAIVPASSGVLDILGALVDQSLVRVWPEPDGEPRFSMLGTIREVAREEFDAVPERVSVLDRHAVFFGDLAERASADFFGSRQHAWLRQLETDHDNLRAALAWMQISGQVTSLVRLASALPPFWLYRGHLSEGRTILERALGAARYEDLDRPLTARAVTRLASLFTEQGEFAPASALLERSRLIRADLSDGDGLGNVHSGLGAIAEYQGDDDLAWLR